MGTIVIIGCGNIGYRHLQAATGTAGVDRVVVVEARPQRRAEIGSQVFEGPCELVTAGAIEDARDAIAEAAMVIVAVTADRQPSVAARLADLGPRVVLLEKPVAQSIGHLDAVTAAFQERCPPGGVYVNCARATFPGWRLARDLILDAGVRVEMTVTGTGWGYGCNAVHFLEAFRFVTAGAGLSCVESALVPQAGASKRGSRYEEYVGTATFRTPQGDRLVLECAEGDPSMVSIEVRAVRGDAPILTIDEPADTVVDHARSRAHPLGALPVSRSTSAIIERAARGVATGLPTLREAVTAHMALFESLRQSTGAHVFAIT